VNFSCLLSRQWGDFRGLQFVVKYRALSDVLRFERSLNLDAVTVALGHGSWKIDDDAAAAAAGVTCQ
jgi:hypothetical protein